MTHPQILERSIAKGEKRAKHSTARTLASHCKPQPWGGGVYYISAPDISDILFVKNPN
jgi:hypothetical protein